MENNSKLQLNPQSVSLLEIHQSSVTISVVVLQPKSKFQFLPNSTHCKKVSIILIPLILNKCLFVIGRNSDFLNNFMLF
jgi:hypothetical protein